jgi:hypothetical protein
MKLGIERVVVRIWLQRGVPGEFVWIMKIKF